MCLRQHTIITGGVLGPNDKEEWGEPTPLRTLSDVTANSTFVPGYARFPVPSKRQPASALLLQFTVLVLFSLLFPPQALPFPRASQRGGSVAFHLFLSLILSHSLSLSLSLSLVLSISLSVSFTCVCNQRPRPRPSTRRRSLLPRFPAAGTLPPSCSPFSGS